MYIINFILQLQNWHPFALTQRYIFRETTVLKTSLHSPGSLKVVKFTTHFLNKFFPSLHISISQSRLEHFINTSLFQYGFHITVTIFPWFSVTFQIQNFVPVLGCHHKFGWKHGLLQRGCMKLFAESCDLRCDS